MVYSKMKYLSAFFLYFAFFWLMGAGSIELSDIETALIQERYQEAENMVQSFIDSYPLQDEYQQALYYLGLIRLRQGQYPKARETFRICLQDTFRRPIYDKAYIGLIDSYYLEGNFKEGLKLAEELYEHKPDSEILSLVYLKIARGNLKLSRWKKARQYLRKIINKYPESLEAHLAEQLMDEEKYFAVQVGSFLDRERAERLLAELRSKGQYAYIVETTDPEEKTFYRVRVGEMTDLQQANRLKERLNSFGYPTRIYP